VTRSVSIAARVAAGWNALCRMTVPQGGVDQDLGQVGELAVGQLAARCRAGCGDHPGIGAEVACAALRHPGRTAGGHHHGEVALTGTALQRGRVLLAGQLVEAERDLLDGPNRPAGHGGRRQQVCGLGEYHDQAQAEIDEHLRALAGVGRGG
jgi:hypothetical protein